MEEADTVLTEAPYPSQRNLCGLAVMRKAIDYSGFAVMFNICAEILSVNVCRTKAGIFIAQGELTK